MADIVSPLDRLRRDDGAAFDDIAAFDDSGVMRYIFIHRCVAGAETVIDH